MEKKGWKILAIVLIVLLILFSTVLYGMLGANERLIDEERENIKSCAIGCYLQGYGNSIADASIQSCVCNYPYNSSMPSPVKAVCNNGSCTLVPL
jgi:hypothetical protein